MSVVVPSDYDHISIGAAELLVGGRQAERLDILVELKDSVKLE